MSHSPSPIDLTRNEAITGESLGKFDDYLPPLPPLLRTRILFSPSHDRLDASEESDEDEQALPQHELLISTTYFSLKTLRDDLQVQAALLRFAIVTKWSDPAHGQAKLGCVNIGEFRNKRGEK